jgi:hypothetical protein
MPGLLAIEMCWIYMVEIDMPDVGDQHSTLS